MTDDGERLPPAGWYADPGGGHGLRWWDGSRWTEHTHERNRPGPLQVQESPATALRDEEKIAQWARYAVVVSAFAAPVTAALYLPQLRALRDLFANPAALAAVGDPALAVQPSPWFTLSSSLQTAAAIVLLVWVYRAATAAQRLRLPLRRSPGWAVGSWFIPVLNLWWPCQSLRDLLPARHPTRRTITLLWILYLLSVVAYVGGAIALFAGGGRRAEMLFLASAAVQACGLLAGRTVIDRVLEAHTGAATAQGVAPAAS